VLSALAHALACDTCWEVRKAAAWSIAYQGGRVDEGVLALYLASKLDPHYMVRDAANDALGVLLVCRRDCFKDLFARADDWAKNNRARYKPGGPDCGSALAEILGGVVVVPAKPVPPPAKTAAPKSSSVALPPPTEPGVLPRGEPAVRPAR
jgi:hypothetical protein